ncbi:MAG: hypothetical protein LQ339_007139 [Xanthoria mediterranea]|nr:MAG: hypothetical protein LQ339_007139 [Xanthoria mediterranea]
MSERTHLLTRVVSVIAATFISLACGTNYAYSAWGPQFAERMRFSSTQSNLIGTFGNLGMYVGGIPVGILVDSKGPKPGVVLGGSLLGSGYFALHRAYEGGPGSIALPWLCFFNFLTGVGGVSAFSGSIKTSALNWPTHRGTSTAFPLSSFGLGAFFFAFISNVAFPDNASSFLLLLSLGCLSLCYLSVAFLRVVPPTQLYTPVTINEDRQTSNLLHRTKSKEDKAHNHNEEPDTRSADLHASRPLRHHLDGSSESVKPPDKVLDETSSLMSRSSNSTPGDATYADDHTESRAHHDSHHLDIRGLALLKQVEFYQLWLLLGTLTGVGLMTINNIGNDASSSCFTGLLPANPMQARALWNYYDDSASPVFIQKRQLRHVMLLSVFSCVGRLSSGIGSDLIVTKLHGSRFWCLFLSSSIFCVAQICGATIGNPHYLGFVSGITGLAYGFLYGVFPSLVAQAFGVNGLSQNWGAMTLAPIIFGNIFNLLYGHIYDHHSYGHDGQMTCPEGLECYKRAYWLTLGGSCLAVGLSLWSIRYANRKQSRTRHFERDDGRDA